MKQDFENTIADITKNYRETAKGKITFDELEDLAWEYHQKIGKLFLEGITSDKGDGKEIELPEPLYNLKGKKPKNKGLKKRLDD